MKKEFTCQTCHETKVATEFVTEKRNTDGITGECKACRRARRRTNGEYLQERLRKYEKRKDDGAIHITADQLSELLNAHNCVYCGDQLTSETTTCDHIYPLSQSYGGVNLPLNIAGPVCRSCNSSKGNDHIYDFYRRSDKFTPQLWTAFVRTFSERFVERTVTDIEVEQMKHNLELEADILRCNAQKGRAANE
ncbi:HNH endonuclease [Bacillus sp. 37MA]|uniref:HNH endonuclease n=1 Tax=Bacillus sp. 37MA TaxID=1132442 RepID=UPI000365CFB9|nr:HNH endonuclease [Bacillus sp. 37MA]